ncbi:TRAM domain-containing protein [Natronorubrum sp. JWXQ-INN-674]|uniref:TRAM domain-containing protein n=1 Tax=Natronorubrum halalkaliphilum TaxID=2691917 RepID=A0A6B0VG89_9EURY|nr:TRAM domain-containing protein [Natronorubrum halalkaliphilum]MXV60514.1 TRAM domain-containing protein [Natronorubrum halalkaliphilum]
MKISERLLCLFSGQIEERDGSYVIEVPEQELQLGDIDEEHSYRVAVLQSATDTTEQTESTSTSTSTSAAAPKPESTADRTSTSTSDSLQPPVEEGETRTVEIEDIGDQGDGITRVERGYVVIVSDADKGERVRIEITQVQENVAFADVIERIDYYE